MPAGERAIDAGSRKQSADGERVGERRKLEIRPGQPREHSRRPPQPARQHAALFDARRTGALRRVAATAALVRPQRKHEASSTIQLNSSPKLCPAWAAISGTSDVGVMPGCVLTSSQMTSPFSE